MATKVILPKQGLQMTEGKIIQWFLNEGEPVKEGQPLYEMETDKVSMEIESPADGTLLKILVEEGDEAEVAQLIAIIGEPGEDLSEIMKGTASPEMDAVREETPESEDESDENNRDVLKVEGADSSAEVMISPRAKKLALENDIALDRIKGSGPNNLIIERDVELVLKNSRNKISPVARRLAEKNNVAIDEITGTGFGGKVVKSDIQKRIETASTQSMQRSNSETVLPLNGIRRVIAENMMQSLHEKAQANHQMKVDMTEILKIREKFKSDNLKISINDIVVKIVSQALSEYPMINASLTEENIVLRNYINIGIAVAIENGLIVPVIRNADRLCLREIAEVSSDLIEKAKARKLTSSELSESTFTISNLGMFDVDEFTAIINSDESGIIAIGKIDRIPVVDGDDIVIRPIMVLSLTYDHRIIDGAPAAQFLRRIKQLMQNPYLLI